MTKEEIEKKNSFTAKAEKVLPDFQRIFASRCSGISDTPIDFQLMGAQKNHQYAIMYLYRYNMFCVWDIKVHIGISYCLNVSKSAQKIRELIDKNKGFYGHYKELGKNYSGEWEKVLFVDMHHLEYFFEHYKVLMSFNEYDIGFPDKLKGKHSEIYSEIERKRYSTSQWKRATDFREKVLDSYGHKCAICRCTIEEVLQAAHERDYAVKDTSTDDYRHGICLCANHHLMYDCKLIDIDLKNLTVNYNNEALKEMICFKIFNEEYAGKIIKQAILQED